MRTSFSAGTLTRAHALLLLALLLPVAGCQTRQDTIAREVFVPVPGAPIWQHTDAPLAPGIVRMTPGEERVLSVIGLGGDYAPLIEWVRQEGTTHRLQTAMTGNDGVHLRAPEGAGGMALVRVSTGRGVFAIPVFVDRHPEIAFGYSPEEGEEPGSVRVAGTFTAWEGQAVELDREPDGTFFGRIRVPPGDHEYKLIVDGEWVADPANPRRQEGGYGNSLLTVEPAGEPRIAFYPLGGRQVPEPGQGGGLLHPLEESFRLDPARLTVLRNNQELHTDHFTADTETGIVVLRLPAGEWAAAEHEITVLYTHEDGEVEGASFRLATADAPRTPRDEIIYSIVTDRFYDGNPELNRPAEHPELHPIANYKGGDWEGIIRKMDEGYFDRLGVTTLWISPVNKNTPKIEQESVEPGRYFTSYHGYWPVSSTETNEQFGSMEDLRRLVGRAHESGMAVLLDFVANHVHEDHPLLEEFGDRVTPYELPDGRRNLRLWNEHPYTTWFDDFLPTLDFEASDALVDFQAENAAWWLRETGADGFRHDAVKHVPARFWRALTERLRQDVAMPEGRRVYQLGETIESPEVIRRYIGPDMMDGQFDFPLHFAIRDTAATGQGNMAGLARAIRRSKRAYLASSINSPLAGNHDVPRFMAYADGILGGPDAPDDRDLAFEDPPVVLHDSSYRKLQFAFGIVFALDGPPTVYYGDEIGMTGAADPDNRRFMQWDGWNEHQQATFDLVSRLAHARRDSVALRRGALVLWEFEEERLAIARVAPEETVLVFLAREPEPGRVDLPLPPFLRGARGLEALAEHGAEVRLQDGRFTWQAEDWSVALHRVRW